MNAITLKSIKEALTRKDAPLFKGEMNLTLVGIRSADMAANTFNDRLCVLYQDDKNAYQMEQFPITTDPGVYYREHPINVLGTAILKPGHYKGCWQIGAHRGQYTALVQRGEMTVYRDNNKDAKLDIGIAEETGFFGINLHHAALNGFTLKTDKWSAGCQVFASIDDFNHAMELVQRSAKIYGNRFSYTLLEEKDLCQINKETDSPGSSAA